MTEKELYEILQRSNTKTKRRFGVNDGWNALSSDILKNSPPKRMSQRLRWRVGIAASFLILVSAIWGIVEISSTTEDYSKELSLIDLKHEEGKTNIINRNQKVLVEQLTAKHDEIDFIELDQESSHLVVKQNLEASTVKPEMKKLSVAYGTTQRIQLADGTSVMLNSGSVLVFPEKFVGKARKVYFEGEGFFEVIKNSKQPFIVVTKNASVKVLGTKFNLKAFQDGSDNITSLVEGRVLVNHFVADTEYKLEAGEQLTLKSKKENKVEPFNRKDVLAWTQRKLILKGAPFINVRNEIERFYDIQIECNDASLWQMQLVGEFDSYRKEDVFKAIQLLKDCSIDIKGKRITIKSNN